MSGGVTALHKEPVGFNKKINWQAPADWNPEDMDYYAAQGNATRIFQFKEIDVSSFGWKVTSVRRISSFSYIASGGYSKPQMYPDRMLPAMQRLDKILDHMPRVFGTRLLAVLEKNDNID